MAVIFAIEFIGVLRILNNFAGDSIKKCVDDYLNYLKSRRNRRQHAPVAGLALMITEWDKRVREGVAFVAFQQPHGVVEKMGGI